MTIGGGASQRIGMKVSFTSIEFRFRIVALAAATASINRWMVVLDRQCNGVAPAFPDVITPAAIWGMRNLAYRKRFKLITDKTRYSAPVGADPSRVYVHTYIKFRRPIITEYNTNNVGDVTDISTNSISFMCYGDNAANFPTMDKLQVRLRYTDL